MNMPRYLTGITADLSDESVVIHESLPIGILLGLTGGLLNAYSYLFHGEVFASMQSGNVILLGLCLAEGNLGKIFHYLLPIMTFFIGIIATEVIKTKFPKNRLFEWQNLAVLLEAIGIFAIGSFSGQISDLAFNSALSFFAAIQVNTYRKLAGMPYATTMTTGNIRSEADYLYQWLIKGDQTAKKKAQYTLLIILSFLIGAVLAALLAGIFDGRTIWLTSLFLMGVFVISLHYQMKYS